MKYINICFCPLTPLYSELIKHTTPEKKLSIASREWKESKTLFCRTREEFEQVLDSFSVDTLVRVIYAGIWKLHISSDLQVRDILFPNTFLSKNNPETFYLDYAVWEAFDFEKFVLHQDGVCCDVFSEVSETFEGDIEEAEVYSFLKYLKKKKLLEKSVVLLGTNPSLEDFERIGAIIEMMTSE